MKFIISQASEESDFFLMFDVDIDEISEETGLDKLADALEVVSASIRQPPSEWSDIDEHNNEVNNIAKQTDKVMQRLFDKY